MDIRLMRKVFSSARIENVEGVAKYLGDAGVEVRIVNGRSYRSAIRGNFSYREQATRGPQPEVWVLRSEDYPRARQLLREAGLEQRGHVAGGGFAAPSMHGSGAGVAATTRRPASRARRGALIAVALAVAAGYFALRWAASRAPPPAPPESATATGGSPPTHASMIADPPAIHRQPTPPALAAVLVEDALEEALEDAPPGARACVMIDGKAPPPDFGGAALRSRVLAAPECSDAGLQLLISNYRTDGSGLGTVEVSAARGPAAPIVRTLEVERTGFAWKVIGDVATP